MDELEAFGFELGLLACEQLLLIVRGLREGAAYLPEHALDLCYFGRGLLL
ncbi:MULTISPECIES: hypothetical protein [Micrococcaceae]|nr:MULTISPECIES: hypothetical protein [unclassified Kocuria]